MSGFSQSPYNTTSGAGLFNSPLAHKLPKDDTISGYQRVAEMQAELNALKEACWDAYRILGFDTDGADWRCVEGQDWPAFVRKFAEDERQTYEEALDEVAPPMEQVGWAKVEGSRVTYVGRYYPGEAGHADHVRIYRKLGETE